jgi:hypothetical protein
MLMLMDVYGFYHCLRQSKHLRFVFEPYIGIEVRTPLITAFSKKKSIWTLKTELKLVNEEHWHPYIK